jgi:uncharacterized membrane protein
LDNNPFMDLPDAVASSDNPFMQLPDAPKNTMGVLPEWAQTLHSYLDPNRVFAGKAGQREDLSPVDSINMLSMALPAGKGATVAPTSKTLHDAGNATIDAARNSSVALDPAKVGSWAQNLQMGLRRKGIQPTQTSAPNTHAILADLQKPGPENPYLTNGKNFTVGDYIDLRRALQKQAQNFSPTAKFDQAAASAAIKRLDNVFDTASQSSFVSGTPKEIYQVRSVVKEARANQAAGFRSDTLENKAIGAQLEADSAGSGMNIDNTIRRKQARLVTPDNPRGIPLAKRQGYSPEEIAQMEGNVRGTFVQNRARDFGNMLGGGKGLNAVLSAGGTGAALGLATGNPVAALGGMAAPVAGVGLKMLENSIAKKSLGNLANSVRLRSPLGAQAQPGPYSENALAIKLLSLLPTLAGNQ